MNASNSSTQAKHDVQSRQGSSAKPTMQPVGKVLDLVANANRIDDPWFWRDRWAD